MATQKDVENPTYWCKIFMTEYKKIENASKFGGSIPRDTGRLQDNSIKITFSGVTMSQLEIGGGEKPTDGEFYHPDKNNPPVSWYAGDLEDDTVTFFGNLNRHRNFVERFIGNEFMASLADRGIEVVRFRIINV
jgi:hypothetical protein